MGENMFEDELNIMDERTERSKVLDSSTFLEPVKRLKVRKLITIDSGQSVREALALMQRNHSAYVVATKQGKVSGILTERDFITKVLGTEGSLENMKVESIMTPDPECVQPDDSLGFVMNAMHVGGYRHVPVVDENHLPIAVISVKDVIGYIVEKFPEEILNLPPHPLRKAGTVDGG